MTNRILIALLGLLVLATETAAAQADLPSAVNMAGRQRMLSQRIAKAYCQIALGVMVQESRRLLQDSVALFDAQLVELAPHVSGSDARSATADLARLWGPYRIRATGPVSREGCAELTAASDPLLAAANRLTTVIEARANTTQAHLVNVSGRQRMVTQRLAKLYMLRATGYDSPQLRSDMESATALFSVSLAELQQAPENTPLIREQLDNIALQWEWFRSALEEDGEESYRALVAEASESILRDLEQVVSLYQGGAAE
jgi:nitrate/nitrite-specific signal transduction histidine kinase